MFQNALSIVDACGLSHLHVFPYSPREGTPAARMPQLDRSLIKERARRLRAKGDEAHHAHLTSLVGTRQTLLIEKPGIGRTENFALTSFPEHLGEPGTLIGVDIVAHDDGMLRAENRCRSAA